MAGIVDIVFDNQVFGDKEIDKYIEQLEKIEHLRENINNPKKTSSNADDEAKKKQESILKIARQTLEIEKQLALAQKNDNQELLNTLNYMKKQLSSGEALTSLQLKALDYVKSTSKIKLEEVKNNEKLMQSEKNRLSLIEDLRHRIKLSTAERATQYKYAKKLDDLEGKTGSETFGEQLKKLKQQFELETKQAKDREKSIKEQTTLEKEHYKALQINKKMDLDREKAKISNEERLKKNLFKLELDLIKTNNYAKHKASIQAIKSSKLEVKERIKQYEKLNEAIQMESAQKQGKRTDFTEDLSRLMGLRQLANSMKRNFGILEDFEDRVLQMGIISGRSGVEINEMRGQMFELGLDIPRLTSELVKNIGAVERTGRTYEEAMIIVRNSSALAVVSGESLADSVNVVNKSLKAFGIRAEETAKVMDILHSSTLTTPLDLQAISDGMKNSASAMRNFIEATSKSGEELEDYKIRILELNTALIGNQMQLGRTASSSGLSIRTLATKLTVLEKRAKSMFDSEMALNKVLVDQNKIMIDNADGTQLTSDMLLQMAQNDLPKTIELLSKLYTTGEISRKTLSKMFTGRQSSYLIAQLGLINGDINTYIDNTTKAQKVSEDIQKAMSNWATEAKVARNSIFALKEGFSTFLDNVGAPAIKGFNMLVKAIKTVEKQGGILSKTFLGVGGTIKDVALSIAMFSTVANLGLIMTKLTGLTKAFAGLKSLYMGFKTAPSLAQIFVGNVGGILSAVGIFVAVSSAIFSIWNRINKASKLAQLETLKQRRQLEAQLKIMKATEESLKVQLRTFIDISNVNMVKNIEEGHNIISAMVDETEKLYKLIEIGKKLSVINLPDFKESAEIANEVKKSYSEQLKEKQELYKTENEEFRKAEERYKKQIDYANRLTNIDKSILAWQYTDLDKKEHSKMLKEYEKELKKIKESVTDKSELKEIERIKQREFAEKVTSKRILQINSEHNKEMKKIMGKDFEAFSYYILQKQNSVEDLYKNIQQTNLQGIKLFSIDGQAISDELNNALKDVNAGDVNFADFILTSDLSTAKEFVDLLASSNFEYAEQGAQLFNKRIKTISQELQVVNKFFTTFHNQVDQASKILSGIRIESFERVVGARDIKTFEEYLKIMREYQVLGDNSGQILKDFRKEVEKTAKAMNVDSFKIEQLIDNDMLLEGASTFNTLNTFTDQMSDSLSHIQKLIKKGMGITAKDRESIKEAAELFNMTEEEMLKIMDNTENISDVIDTLKEKSGLTMEDFMKSLIEQTENSKKTKDILMETFFYYDKTLLRQLQFNEATSKGYTQLKARQELLKEEENLSKARYEYEMKTLDLVSSKGKIEGISGLENIEDVLISEKERLEILKSEGKLKEDDVNYYKQIEKALSAVSKRQEDIKNNTQKSQQTDRDAINIIKEKNKYYDDLIQKYKDIGKITGEDLFSDLSSAIKDSNSEFNSQLELMKAIKGKEDELLTLKDSSKEIDDVKKQQLEKEYEILLKIFGIYEKINESQLEANNELKSGYTDLTKDLNDLFESLNPKTLKQQIGTGYKNLEDMSRGQIFDEKSMIVFLEEIKNKSENIVEELTNNTHKIKSGKLNDDEIKYLKIRNEFLKQQLEEIKKITEESAKQGGLEHQIKQALSESIKGLSSFVVAISKGEGTQFNSDSAIQSGMGVLGQMISGEKSVLHGQDYAQLVGAAVGVMDNVMQQSIQAQQQQLQADLEILEMRKQFATSQEEIAEYDKKILETKKKQIDMEARSQTSFLGASGASGGFLEGAFSGALMGAASGNPIVAVVGGVLGGISGLMGGSSAEKQAEQQKRQLELQYVANQLLEEQNDILSQTKEAIDTLGDSLFKGVGRAISDSIAELTSKPSFSYTGEGETSYSWKDLMVTNDRGGMEKINQEYDFGLGEYIDELYSNKGMAVYDFNFADLLSQEFTSSLEKVEQGFSNIDKLQFKSLDDFDIANDEIDKTIENLEKMALLALYDEDREQILMNIEVLKAYGKELERLQKIYTERQDVLIGTYFGFDMETIEDEAGNLQDIVSGAWKPREDIVNNIVKDSYDVGEAVADGFLSGYNSYMISNNEVLQSGLDNIESGFQDLFKSLAGNYEYESTLDELKDIFSSKKTGKTVEQARQDRIITNIIEESKILEEEQKKIQNTAIAINKEYINLGGNLSDVVSNMTDLEKSLYDSFLDSDYTKIGDTIGDEIITGVMESIKDGFTQIFDLEDKINVLSSTDFAFGEDFISQSKALISYGEKFNDLSYEQINDKEYIKELLISIGYSEQQIDETLMSQTQKSLYLNKLMEEEAESADEILTLREEISEIQSDINRDVEEYITKLYDGRFEEQNILDILNEQEKLTSKILANEILTNNVAREWIANGGKISDIYDSLTDVGRSVYDSITEALNADSYEDSVDSLNNFLNEKLSEVWNKFYMDNYGGRITELTSKLTQSMQSGISFTAAQSVSSEIQKLNLQGESQRQRLLALQDMLNTNQEISYDTSSQNVEYSSGSTSQNVYNYYNNLQVSGVVPLTKPSINEFVDVTIGRIIKELKNKNAI